MPSAAALLVQVGWKPPARPVRQAVARAAPSPSVAPSRAPSRAPERKAPEPVELTPGLNGCPAVPAPPALSASYYPRIVIPRVGINLELHEGDGHGPPDHVWVAFHYPGTAAPGSRGNTYIYAHAHGSPQNSAPGLFWPLHYMKVCDLVEIYTSPTTAYRYQTSDVNLHWPTRDTRPLNPTSDTRVTLQTCNTWNDWDPKTIVVALSLDVTPAHSPASAPTQRPPRPAG
jgi:sortase (surface protein transpeptidase)